jgi:hypothetical protein
VGAQEQHPVDDPLLTAGEVAALMRVTQSWVYAETRRDGLPHLRLRALRALPAFGDRTLDGRR